MLSTHEQQWVELIQSGDHRAFETLFKIHYDKLCDFVVFHVGDAQVAEEIVQDIFADIWRRHAIWRPDKSLRAYLHRAARNKVIKHWKRLQVRKRWEVQQQFKPELVEPNPEEVLQHRELEQVMQASIAKMPPRRREIYTLSRQHGLTYQEIALTMDISVKTVENQMGHALRFLRERLVSGQYVPDRWSFY